MRNPRGRLSEGWIVRELDRSMGQAVREVGRAKAGSSEDGPSNG